MEIQKTTEKYYRKIAIAILLITVILLFLSEIFPIIKNILIDRGAINILVLIFVISGIDYLIAISEKLEEKDKIRFYETQYKADSYVYEYIDKKKPTKADLLEYSSTHCIGIISKLGTNCKIRLLIAHPKIAEDLQKGKIIRRIREIHDMDYWEYKNVTARCYYQFSDKKGKKHDAFSSIRGRKFNNEFICIGWYTPNAEIGGGLCGHLNPMICGYTNNKPGRILKKHFDDTFDMLWNSGIPIDDVYDNLESEA